MGDSGKADAAHDDTYVDRILTLRGEPVVLAARVAEVFGVATREVNQAVTRNPGRFSQAHSFVLTAEEVAGLTSRGVISNPGRGGSRALPRVYTQKGVMRLATILTSPTADDATDLMIDLFIEVHRQIAEGRTEITVANPSRLHPGSRPQPEQAGMRARIWRALDALLDTPVSAAANSTLRDEMGDVAGGAIQQLKEMLRSKGLENERVAAETLLVLEKVREIRERTQADIRRSKVETKGKEIENIDKVISLFERLARIESEMEPNALIRLMPEFAPTRAARQTVKQKKRLPKA